MFYSMDDFDHDADYYNKQDSEYDFQNDHSFRETLMVLSSLLKGSSFSDDIVDSSHLMMKIFNMSQLDMDEKNEPALNLIIGLLMHIHALMKFIEDKDRYFKFIDENIIYPMMRDDNE